MSNIGLQSGSALLDNILAGDLEPKALATEERRAVVAVIDGPGSVDGKIQHTQSEMAEILDVSRQTICADLRIIRLRYGHQVMQTNLKEVLGEMVKAKRLCQHHARDEQNWQLFWAIEHCFVENLVKLGIVKRAEMKLNVTGQIDVNHAFSAYTPDQARGLLDIVNTRTEN